MKLKVTIFCLMFLFGGIATHAQTHPDSLAAIYDQLPSSLYPSQILHNRSPLYLFCWNVDSTLNWTLDTNNQASPYLYDGSIPAELLYSDHWARMYADMKISSVNPALIPDKSTLNTRDSIARLIYDVPIGAMHLNFHRINPDALDSGYLFYDTLINKYTVLPDTLWLDRVNGLYQYYPNPDSLAALAFEEHEVFAGVLTRTNIYRAGSNFSITFGLASSLFMENQVDQITYSEMDFDNGQGFVPISFDVPKVVAYNFNTQVESYSKELRLRLHYGSRIVETKMPLMVVPNATVADTSFHTSNLNFLCPVPQNGYTPGQAKVSILYGNPGQKILKPLLLIEGFEGDIRPYGAIHFEGLASGIILDAKGERKYAHMAMFKDAIDSLHLLGYDLVFVDFKDGRTAIQSNSLSVIKTIQWINSELASNESYEKLVVIGASMGGLITRYSLSKMEADGCCHNARLYATWDTPHNGAHIPEGLQHTVKHLHDELGWIDDLAGGLFGREPFIRPSWQHVLNSPGARQMLVNHIDPSSTLERDAFFAELDSLGHPVQCRRIALMSGSEQALANTISRSDKAFFLINKHLWTTGAHFYGTAWQPYANLVGITRPFTTLELNAYAESNPSGIVFEGNNPQLSSQLYATALGVHLSSFSIQLTARLLGYIPYFSAACDAVILGTQTITNGTLAALWVSNFIHTSTSANHTPSTVLSMNYTESPGGLTNTPETIIKSLAFFKHLAAQLYMNPTGSSGLFTSNSELKTSHHTFIPSISAIDLDTNDLYLDVKSFRVPLLVEKLIPFDVYWAPGREDGQQDENQQHVEVTLSNMRWLIEQVEKNDELRHPTTGAYTTQLTGYYNFGRPSGGDFDRPFLKHLYSVDVESTGRLYVNRNGIIGFAGGSEYTGMNSHFECYTGQSCEQPHVRINNGGRFEIGQANTSNTADMYFEEGSVLEVLSGGTVVIHSGSSLTFTELSELILHPGANLVIEQGAQLILQGKVILENGAGFVPTGEGAVVLDQNIQTAARARLFWEVNNGGYIAMRNASGAQLIVQQECLLPITLDSVSISNVDVLLEKNVALHILGSPFVIKRSNVDCVDSLNQHDGIHLYGQPTYIENCRFTHGQQGVYNNMTLGGNTMEVVNSTFKHNHIGLFARDGSIDIANSVFKHNQIGIRFWDAQGTLNIQDGIIADNLDKGIDAAGQSGSSISLTEVALNDNTTAVYAVEMDVKSRCSNFTNSNIGIHANGRSYVFLSEGAQNIFQGNQTSVMLNYVSGIFTENGANDFSGSQWYIQGELTPRNANPSIDLSGNKMPGSSSSSGAVAVPIYVFWIDVTTSQPHSVPLSNWDPSVVLSSSCAPPTGSANPGNDLASDVIRSYTSGKVINTTNYPNTWLNDALADAAFRVSNEEGIYDDLTAIARFSEIFSGVNGTLTDSEHEAFNYAIELMIAALNNAYDQGLLAKNQAVDNEPESPYLQMVTDQIDDQLSEVNISASELFELNLALAQTYRMAEHYDYAQATLNAMGTNMSMEELLTSEYWECVCEAEDDLLKGEIDQTMFATQQENCQVLLENAMKMATQEFTPQSSLIQSTVGQPLVKSLFPNPTTGRVVLEFSEQIEGAVFQLSDVTGKVVKSGEWMNVRSTSIDLSNLNPGMYLLSLTFEGSSETHQIVLTE